VTPAELRPILAAYRDQVAAAWSPATAKPGFDAEPGTPAGQCGVTSAWLQGRLFHDHDIDSVYYTGRVWIGERAVTPAHCWLQHGDIVIDLTGDQFGLNEVVCGYKDTLIVSYLGRPGKRPLQRLRVLEEALS
jgi:hypothetical protein